MAGTINANYNAAENKVTVTWSEVASSDSAITALRLYKLDIDPEMILVFDSATAYQAGDYVMSKGGVWRCTNATQSGEFPVNETANWTEVPSLSNEQVANGSYVDTDPSFGNTYYFLRVQAGGSWTPFSAQLRISASLNAEVASGADAITISISGAPSSALTGTWSLYRTLADITDTAALTDEQLAAGIAAGTYGNAIKTQRNGFSAYTDRDVIRGCGQNELGGQDDDRYYYYILVHENGADKEYFRAGCLYKWESADMVSLINEAEVNKMKANAYNALGAKKFQIAFPAGYTYLVAVSTDSTSVGADDLTTALKGIEAVGAAVVIASSNVEGIGGYTPTINGTFQLKYEAK